MFTTSSGESTDFRKTREILRFTSVFAENLWRCKLTLTEAWILGPSISVPETSSGEEDGRTTIMLSQIRSQSTATLEKELSWEC